MKKSALLLLSIPIMSFAQTEYYCFKNDKNPKMQIQMKLINTKGVSVKYKGQKESIPIVQKDFRNHKGINTYVYIYEEIYRGNVIGEYWLSMNEESIWLGYENYAKNKSYIFDWYATRKKPCF